MADYTEYILRVSGIPGKINIKLLADLVRCRDCVYYNEQEMKCNDTHGFDRYWEPTDFCSYGERRDDGEIH